MSPGSKCLIRSCGSTSGRLLERRFTRSYGFRPRSSPSNQQIRPPIIVECAFFGDAFTGFVATEARLQGQNARQQFVSLARRLADSRDEVKRELLANHKAVFMKFPFWQSLIPATVGVTVTQQEELLAFIDSVWSASAIGFPLSQLAPGEADAAEVTRSHGR